MHWNTRQRPLNSQKLNMRQKKCVFGPNLANLNQRNKSHKHILGKECAALIKDLISKYPDANFFFDETPVGGEDGIPPEDLKAFAKNVSPSRVLWVACDHNHPEKEDLEPGLTILFFKICWQLEQSLYFKAFNLKLL